MYIAVGSEMAPRLTFLFLTGAGQIERSEKQMYMYVCATGIQTASNCHINTAAQIRSGRQNIHKI